MSKVLILEEVTQQGTRELGRLTNEDVLVGREPEPSGIVIPGKAVSRNHGVFTRLRNHWFYRDLGSTNGSWINGAQLAANQWKIVRPGTGLQMADVSLRISAAGTEGNFNRAQSAADSSTIGGRSLIVFADGEFLDEFPIPEYGRALMIGGAQADLQLQGDIFEQPSLVIERRGDSIVAFGMVREVELALNGQVFNDTSRLNDGDTVQVGNYSVLLNDPTRSAAVSERGGSRSSMREWNAGTGTEEPAAPRHRSSKPLSTFGQAQAQDLAGAEETVALHPDELESSLQGAEMHPSMRYNLRSSGVPTLNTFEDRLILGVGVVLSVILMGLVVWWVFF